MQRTNREGSQRRSHYAASYLPGLPGEIQVGCAQLSEFAFIWSELLFQVPLCSEAESPGYC
jgi:hypothetical protein